MFIVPQGHQGAGARAGRRTADGILSTTARGTPGAPAHIPDPRTPT